MLCSHMFHQVRKLKAQGKSQAAIARELKLDPKTVSKYLKSNTPPKYTPRAGPTREDPLKGFEEKIKMLPRLSHKKV